MILRTSYKILSAVYEVETGDGLISVVSSDSKTSNRNVLTWFSSVHRAKVGRPRESKTCFVMKKLYQYYYDCEY